MLAQAKALRDHSALRSRHQGNGARAVRVGSDARNSPDKLPAAIAAEQAAYQALLKVMPREFRMTQRQRNAGKINRPTSAGQPNQRQLDQLDMQHEQNRYETESQAAAPQNAQQREQTQMADRLKELAQRQQDLNDRCASCRPRCKPRARTRSARNIQRQLKRLQDEQRQMLANVDELRQQTATSRRTRVRRRTRNGNWIRRATDMQRASEELQNQSASQALAAGTRAQEAMQNLRDNLQQANLQPVLRTDAAVAQRGARPDETGKRNRARIGFAQQRRASGFG